MSNLSVFLVGPMGAGKTTIGRILAEILGLEFKDSDKVIEDRSGADIPWIFDIEGEEGFRNRETGVLQELALESNLVLATGGGIVVREENRQCLGQAGTVVYLTADIDQLVERTYRDKKRPLLQVDEPEQKIRELIDVREPLYQEVADFTVKTDGRGPRTVALEIARLLQDSH